MNTTIIRQRVADFLKANPPFDQIQNDDLLQLAGAGRIAFHEGDEFIFRQGEARGPLIWVIQQGKVEVLEEGAAGEHLRDLLGEGDLLGLDRFLDAQSFVHSARTASDVILYGLEALAFEAMVERYPSMGQFLDVQLSAIKTYAKGTSAHEGKPDARTENASSNWLDVASPSAEFVARRMAACGRNLGGLEARAGDIVETYWLQMLEARVDSLAIVDGGKQIGVLSAADLAVLTGRDPVSLLTAMDTWCTDADRMVLLERARVLVTEVLVGPWAVDRCARVDAIFERAAAGNLTRLAEEEAGATAEWLGFGVMGRREALGEWVPKLGGVVDASESWRKSALAKAAAKRLPEGTEAPQVLTLDEWKSFYSELIDNPVLNMLWDNRAMLDFRCVSGDGSYAEALEEHVAGEVRASKGFVRILANDTLAQLPQLTFFEEFVIDLDGGTSRTLDLGAAAIDPIVDASRVFAVALGDLGTTHTLGRLETAGKAMPESAEVFQDAAEAFRIACWLKARQGHAVVEPAALDKYSRWLLRRVFSAIHKLLEFTSSRWGLA
ncbi:MAG: putative nucleotidyltransferase substrate binding domain-containing protein [Acidobacteriota bacterium]